jgi:hypothetical protein
MPKNRKTSGKNKKYICADKRSQRIVRERERRGAERKGGGGWTLA